MRREESSVSTDMFTGSSLTKALERPEAESTLRMVRTPPFQSSPAFSTMSSKMESEAESNSASTTQLPPAEPSMELSALPPSNIDRAPSKMDFPAPVGPVIMTRPAGNSISSESIRT